MAVKWDVVLREDVDPDTFDQRRQGKRVTLTMLADSEPEASAAALASSDLPATDTAWTVMYVVPAIEETE